MGRRIVTQRRRKLNSIATMLLEVIRTVSTQYQTAEKMLYSYPVNMMRLREAEERYEEIMSETDCRAQRYDQPQHAIGTHSDPPNEYVVRLMSAEREIERYKKKTRIVDEVKDSLVNSDGEREQGMCQVMYLYYFEGLPMRDISQRLGMNERTLYRRREELVKEVMKQL